MIALLKKILKTWIVLCPLLFILSFPLYGQDETAEEEPTEETAEETEEEPTADAAIEEGVETAAALAEATFLSFGLTFQYWFPFTEVTSSLIGELAGVSSELTGTTKPQGENAEDNLDTVSSDPASIFSLEFRSDGTVDNVHLDLTENSEIDRLNPLENRSEESSKEKNLSNVLEEDKTQTSRLNSQFRLLGLPDVLDLVFRFTEENFVSQVTPSKDTLFISFSGAEALVQQNTKIQLETSFEDRMTGISNFFIPGTEIPIGFIGYFELSFQKPILLPLTPSKTVTVDGSSALVDAVIIFPQFKALGWMVEWYKSKEEGFDISGHLKFGHGNIDIGSSKNRVNTLLLTESPTGREELFSRSAPILFSGGLLRLSFLASFGEISASGEWRVFVLQDEFNGIKSNKPLSVDLITSIEVLYRF